MRAQRASVVVGAPAPARNAAGGNWFAVRRDGIAGLRPMSLKNHLKREAPQHATAARVASVRQNFFRLLSPSKTRRRARSAPTPQAVDRATLDAMRRSGITAPFSVQSYLCHRSRDGFRWDGRRRNHRTSAQPQTSHFDVSIFRFFDVFSQNHPEHASPQHMPAARVASEKIRLCHLMSPWNFAVATPPTRGGATDWRVGRTRNPGGVALRIGKWDTYITHEEWRYRLAGRMPTLPRKFANGCPRDSGAGFRRYPAGIRHADVCVENGRLRLVSRGGGGFGRGPA